MKNKLFSSVLITTAVLGSISTVVFAYDLTEHSLTFQDLAQVNENKLKLLGTKDDAYNYDNALEEDVKQKALSDSALIYFLNWDAIFHRFGPTSHLIKILELNPNKEIYFIKRKNVNVNLDAIANAGFKNFKLIQLETYFETNSMNSIKEQDLFPAEVEEIINKLNATNKKIDFYSDDFFILQTIRTILLEFIDNGNYIQKDFKKVANNLINNFKNMDKFNSLNLFGDGTYSIEFFNNMFYNSFLLSQNGLTENNEYLSTNKFVGKENKDLAFYSPEELMLYLFSFVTTNNKGNEQQRTKYFLPTVQMIKEANLPNSGVLSLNDQNKDYFNPYNSLEADLIDFCKTLNPTSLDFLYKSFNVQVPLQNFDFMNNKTNYVYSGRRLTSDTIIESEANKIIELKREIDLLPPIPGAPETQIIFKGHPRDMHIEEKLRRKIWELSGKTDEATWLKVIDHKIPYEIYLVNGVFQNDPTKNKVVKLYTTWSTINLFIYAQDPSLSMVEQIFMSEADNDTINFWFSEESKIFPVAKRKISK